MEDDLRGKLLARWREDLARQREVLEIWRSGKLVLRSNGQDVTAQAVADLEGFVDRLAALVARVEALDPLEPGA